MTGELQYHAIGCYTVHRPVKVGVPAGEAPARQAEIALDHVHGPSRRPVSSSLAAWTQVGFPSLPRHAGRDVHSFGV